MAHATTLVPNSDALTAAEFATEVFVESGFTIAADLAGSSNPILGSLASVGAGFILGCLFGNEEEQNDMYRKILEEVGIMMTRAMVKQAAGICLRIHLV